MDRSGHEAHPPNRRRLAHASKGIINPARSLRDPQELESEEDGYQRKDYKQRFLRDTAPSIPAG